jgi:hypothetical protein
MADDVTSRRLFWVRHHARRAQMELEEAAQNINDDVAYLQPEVEDIWRRLKELLDKLAFDEKLQNDSAALQGAADPEQGIGEWTSGKTTGLGS